MITLVSGVACRGLEGSGLDRGQRARVPTYKEVRARGIVSDQLVMEADA